MTMQRQAKRTAGPWEARLDPNSTYEWEIVKADPPGSDDVWYIAACVDGAEGASSKANARFIVTACNAHDELVAALRLVRGIIVEAAMTGFNCHDGDWAERLYASQAVTHAALAKLEGK